MLRQVFQTVPLPYRQGPAPWLVYYYHAPYLEKLNTYYGIFVGKNLEVEAGVEGSTSIYVWAQMATAEWPAIGFFYGRFDGKSGKFIRRVLETRPQFVAGLTLMNRVMASRRGVPYCVNIFGDTLYKLTLGKTINEPVGFETDPTESWDIVLEGQAVNDVLGTGVGYPAARLGLSGYGLTAYDDVQDLFMNIAGQVMTVYNWAAGTIRYSIELPHLVQAVALEEAQHMYILLVDRTIMLFDYMRGEVLGASKIPILPSGTGLAEGGIKIGYDPIYKRMLVAEPTPNAADGGSTNIIRGYRMVPEPIRITVPIPLKAPRQRRIIPVLVQVVGDTNEGVGGYVINAKVTGSGSLVGIPISDHVGNTLLQVACEGHSLFGGNLDWSETGSPEATPPHTGLVNIEATAKVYTPPFSDLPVSGVPGPTPGGTPGQPGGGGTGEGELPETAPNMKYILDNLFNSKVWNFAEWNEDNPNGRGQFTEEGVRAIHDVDPRFGHIRKRGGQNQYNGHAVDALNFLNDDGVTAEIFDIAGGNADSKPSWHFWKRLEENRDKWYYPA